MSNTINALPHRADVPENLTWDLSGIYATEEEMYRDAERAEEMAWHIAAAYQGKLNNPHIIDQCLTEYQKVCELMMLTGNYCDLAVSADYYDVHNQERYGRISRRLSSLNSLLSFIDSEIMDQDEALILEAASFQNGNRSYLENLLRNKKHRLHPEAERALAALSPSLYAPYEIYNAAKLADMKFADFQADGESFPLGYSLFEDNYEYDSRTEVRRSAFCAFSEKIAEYENVTAAAYNANLQTEKTLSDLRGFRSVYDSLLFSQRVEQEMHHRQIDLIMEKLAPHMRKYAWLLQRVHHLGRMTFADLKLPVDPSFDPQVTIQESREYIEKGLAILGEDYVEMVRTAYRDRWIDFARNKGKSAHLLS